MTYRSCSSSLWSASSDNDEMDAIREFTQESPVPLTPLSSNRMEQCDLELGRPVQYLLPQLSFPSTLRADGIYHSFESYADQESEESSTESSL